MPTEASRYALLPNAKRDAIRDVSHMSSCPTRLCMSNRELQWQLKSLHTVIRVHQYKTVETDGVNDGRM